MSSTGTTTHVSSTWTRATDGSDIHVTVTQHQAGRVAMVTRKVAGQVVWGQCGTPEWAEECAAKAVRNPAQFVR